MRVDVRTQTTLDRALAGEDLTWDEALWLVGLPVHSTDCYALMAVDREGGRSGLDTALLADASALVDVPIILEGGAGSLDQVAAAMQAGADAVALGPMLVFSDNNIFKVKSFLKNAGLDMRL
jgi:imidazole glycerol phosphate synthase subunit HisF